MLWLGYAVCPASRPFPVSVLCFGRLVESKWEYVLVKCWSWSFICLTFAGMAISAFCCCMFLRSGVEWPVMLFLDSCQSLPPYIPRRTWKSSCEFLYIIAPRGFMFSSQPLSSLYRSDYGRISFIGVWQSRSPLTEQVLLCQFRCQVNWLPPEAWVGSRKLALTNRMAAVLFPAVHVQSGRWAHSLFFTGVWISCPLCTGLVAVSLF